MTATIEVSKVSNKAQLREFIHFIWKLYDGVEHWVSPLLMSQQDLLDRRRHPFWENMESDFFLAREDGKTVGRIAVFCSKQETDRQTGYFGFLECIDQQLVLDALTNRAEAWLQHRSIKRLIGPFNPGLNYEIGFLTKGFDQPPYFMMPYSRDYYPTLMEAAGFSKVKDFHAYYLSVADWEHDTRLQRASSWTRQRFSDVAIRAVDRSKLASELDTVREIYNDAFAEHWGFQAMSKKEFEHLAQDLEKILEPELVLLALKGEEPIAFILGAPNYNEVFRKIPDGRLFPWGIFKLLWHRRKIRNVRIMTVAVRKAHQNTGIGWLLFGAIARNIARLGYEGGEMSWVMEDNFRMKKSAISMGGRLQKQYRVYQKEL